jgi:hypothetical protein
MAKLILLSIMIYMTVLPVAVAQRPSPKRTLRNVQILTFVGVVLWALACRKYYPELVPIE